jgi:hypothetical protein
MPPCYPTPSMEVSFRVRLWQNYLVGRQGSDAKSMRKGKCDRRLLRKRMSAVTSSHPSRSARAR